MSSNLYDVLTLPWSTACHTGSAGQNKQHLVTKNTAKLDRETEELHHDRVSLEVGKVIQKGRQDTGLTQKDLATVSIQSAHNFTCTNCNIRLIFGLLNIVYPDYICWIWSILPYSGVQSVKVNIKADSYVISWSVIGTQLLNPILELHKQTATTSDSTPSKGQRLEKRKSSACLISWQTDFCETQPLCKYS